MSKGILFSDVQNQCSAFVTLDFEEQIVKLAIAGLESLGTFEIIEEVDEGEYKNC